MGESLHINRAPVLALWAAVVAERPGYGRDEALSLGKALTGLNAQSKGRRLGIYEKREKGDEKVEGTRPPAAEVVELMGRQIAATRTAEGVRAVTDGRPVSSDSARRYLESKFGVNLPAVRAALEKLARSLEPEALASRAFALYEEFRPTIPEGVRGWGAKGRLDLELIGRLTAGTKGVNDDEG